MAPCEFKTICDIGKERIRRAGEKIKKDFAGKPGIENLDIGFRVFKVDSSNMKESSFAPAEYDQKMLSDLEDQVKPDRTALDLIFGAVLEMGMPLSVPHKEEKFNGFTIHNINNGEMLACMEENLTEEIFKHLAERKPRFMIFRDHFFKTSADKINAQHIFKQFSPKTRVWVF